MKITEGHGPVSSCPTQKLHRGEKSKDNFQKVMEQVSGQAEATNANPHQTKATVVPEGVCIVRETFAVDTSRTEEGKGRLIKELEKSLDLVDFYATKLADQSSPARKLDRLVEHLQNQLLTLDKMRLDQKLPEQLRSITSDLAMTIGTEVAKYKRGDYS